MTHIHHTDEELLSYASSLYHVALTAHASSQAATKRSLLFLYLFGYRYLSRRQIFSLTSYHPVTEKKNGEEFISKFVRAGLIKKCSTDTALTEDTLYTPTRTGITLGREYFISETTRILTTKDVFYLPYVTELLLGEPDNLASYADTFMNHTTTRYKNKLRMALHRIATMDSFIALLTSLIPATLLSFSPEVSIYRGEICDDFLTHLNAEADVRSDAVLFLSTTRAGLMRAPDKDSHMVCIEQDTSHQSATVLADKITRYINHVVLPRHKDGFPTTLIFSVLPANRAAKATGGSIRPADAGYVEDILRFATLYCNHIGSDTNRISLSDFLAGFPSFCGNSPLFSRHLSFLTDRIESYGPHLPISKLLSRHEELAAQDSTAEIAQHKLIASFHRRKETIYGVLDRMNHMETVACTGFSLCVTCNYAPVSLSSLFPELCSGRELLPLVTGNKAPITAFTPFYTYHCTDGTEITFRNAYHVGSTVYIMENIAEDYFAMIRLLTLLAHDPEPAVTFLAVFPLVDYLHFTKLLHDTATPAQREVLYGCAYHEESHGNIAYVAPVRVDLLPPM